jgi:hypothetical protein
VYGVSKGWGRLGQQILNLLDRAGARAAAAEDLRGLDRRELEDCGLTPADVAPHLQDLYEQDFRVTARAWRHAA